MVRTIRAIYTDSVDPYWITEEVTEILLAPDLVLESTEEEPNIFVLDYPVNDGQSFVYIDRANCKRFRTDFLEMDNIRKTNVDLNWLRRATFLQVVRVFAAVPGLK